MDAEDEANHRALYDRNRQELISMWFGHSFPWKNNGFIEMAGELIKTVGGCDVIGIPYNSWIEHEYRISSQRGVPSLTNVLHSLTANSQHKRKFCSQLAHLDLANSSWLDKILRLAPKVSVISCLEEVPSILKQRFGLEDVEFHRIPGEQGSRSILGDSATRGTHYPDRFNELIRNFSQPQQGQLFLIAAGLLGKIYAVHIRRSGGIALDIGSVFDKWAGLATRPGY